MKLMEYLKLIQLLRNRAAGGYKPCNSNNGLHPPYRRRKKHRGGGSRG